MDWNKTIFLHAGWAIKYDGTEAPRGGHAYLQQAVGVEAANFKPDRGWCYGYAPVSRAAKSRGLREIPKAGRTLKIVKLGAAPRDSEIDGITVIRTATRPQRGPVIVGICRNATVFHFMPPDEDVERPFIAKARVENCYLVPASQRTFPVPKGQKGFPGKQAAVWYPGEHQDGPAHHFLAQVAKYIAALKA